MDRGMQHDTSTFEASLIQNFGLTSPRARRGPISIVVSRGVNIIRLLDGLDIHPLK
jgi:hypothetical protein